MSKRKAAKPNLIVAQGTGWHIEFDRTTKDYAAMIDGVGYIGSAARPHEAQSLINQHRLASAQQAA